MSRKDIVFEPAGLNVRVTIKPDKPITICEIHNRKTGRLISYGISRCRGIDTMAGWFNSVDHYSKLKGMKLALRSACGKLITPEDDESTLQMTYQARRMIWDHFNSLVKELNIQ